MHFSTLMDVRLNRSAIRAKLYPRVIDPMLIYFISVTEVFTLSTNIGAKINQKTLGTLIVV